MNDKIFYDYFCYQEKTLSFQKVKELFVNPLKGVDDKQFVSIYYALGCDYAGILYGWKEYLKKKYRKNKFFIMERDANVLKAIDLHANSLWINYDIIDTEKEERIIEYLNNIDWRNSTIVDVGIMGNVIALIKKSQGCSAEIEFLFSCNRYINGYLNQYMNRIWDKQFMIVVVRTLEGIYKEYKKPDNLYAVMGNQFEKSEQNILQIARMAFIDGVKKGQKDECMSLEKLYQRYCNINKEPLRFNGVLNENYSITDEEQRNIERIYEYMDLNGAKEEIKVLLIDPFYNNGTVPPHYSLGEIERKLIDSVKVLVEDFVIERKYTSLQSFKEDEKRFFEQVKETVKKEKPKVIYITTSYGIPIKQKPVLPRVKVLIDEIKNTNLECDIYIGGMGINYIYKEIRCVTYQMDKDVHLVVGDECDFADTICRKYNLSETTQKLILWKNWNLNKYPKYLSFLSAKGCPSKCTFCMENKVYNSSYFRININDVYDNILFFYNKGYKAFAIEDSSFLFNKSYVYFCQKLIREKVNIQWTCYAKLHQIIKNRDKLKLMSCAGCTSMIVGIEVYDDRMLNVLKKELVCSEIEMALAYLSEAGIKIQGCFMLGIEGQDKQSLINNIEYAKSLNLFTYRWHIYQKNINELLGRNEYECALEYEKLQLNIPDECLGEYIDELHEQILYLNEEHFLIRCLEGKVDSQKIRNYQIANVTYRWIYEQLEKRMNCYTYDEEKMYQLIGDNVWNTE